jgi:hypothetical protein
MYGDDEIAATRRTVSPTLQRASGILKSGSRRA